MKLTYIQAFKQNFKNRLFLFKSRGSVLYVKNNWWRAIELLEK